MGPGNTQVTNADMDYDLLHKLQRELEDEYTKLLAALKKLDTEGAEGEFVEETENEQS